MPIYEYQCEVCQEKFEKIVFNAEAAVVCPRCHSQRCERLLSTFSFSLGGRFTPSTMAGGCSACRGGGCACHHSSSGR